LHYALHTWGQKFNTISKKPKR